MFKKYPLSSQAVLGCTGMKGLTMVSGGQQQYKERCNGGEENVNAGLNIKKKIHKPSRASYRNVY